MPDRPMRLTLEDWLPLLIIPISSVGAWFLPDEYLRYVFAFLILGVLFDLLSLVAHVATLVTKRFSSGFPLVGLFFYAWFVLAYRKSLVAPHETTLPLLLLYKLLDLVLLVCLHGLCQLPMAFQGPRDRYR
jgi:hypothetical protein